MYAVLAICALAGAIFGPVSWISSANFFHEYETFQKDAIELKGEVFSKRTKQDFRAGTDYIGIKFFHNNTNLRAEIEVERPLWNHLYMMKQVKIFYNPKKSELIKLKMENEGEFLPPILKQGLGKWITITSYGILGLFIISRKRKEKKEVGID